MQYCERPANLAHLFSGFMTFMAQHLQANQMQPGRWCRTSSPLTGCIAQLHDHDHAFAPVLTHLPCVALLGPVLLGPVLLGPVLLGPVLLGPVLLGPVLPC